MSIIYDQYFVRKKEIAENILMIVICDTLHDGHSHSPKEEVSAVMGPVMEHL